MPSFEEQLVELEQVVERLERGDLPLEENVALFERGVVLSEACKRQLAAAESRIELLLHPQEEGAVEVEALRVETEEEGEFGDDDGGEEE